MTKHINPPVPRAISIEFETYPAARSRFTAEVEGATIIAEGGRVLSGQRLIGDGAVAGVIERQTRDQTGSYRCIAIQRDGYLEIEAIWDGDCLVDGDGADIAEVFEPDE